MFLCFNKGFKIHLEHVDSNQHQKEEATYELKCLIQDFIQVLLKSSSKLAFDVYFIIRIFYFVSLTPNLKLSIF